jgi:hypothetical protein
MNYKLKLKVTITFLSLIAIIFPINVATAFESDNYAYNAIGQYGKLVTSNAGYEYKFTDAPGRGDNPGVAYIGAPDPEKVVNVITASESSESSYVQTDKVNCDEEGKIWDSTITILWNAEMDSVTYLDCDQFTIYKFSGHDFTEKPIIDVTLGVSSKARSNQAILTLSLSTSSKSYPFTQALTLSTTGGSGSGDLTYSVSNGTATGCSLSSNSSSTTITASTAGTCSIVATKGQDADYNSTNSSAKSFTLSAIAPDAVTSLIASSDKKSCSLNWTAGSANGADITDYIIEYRQKVEINYTTFSDGTGTATFTTVTALVKDTEYTLRVTAVNSTGSGPSTTVICMPAVKKNK